VGIAITLPIIIGLQLGYFEVGLALSFGAFWSSPSDVSGNFRHKIIGILISAGLVTIVSFIGGYLHYETWISLPILGVLAFGLSFISVYGLRASLISFSGLLALVLAFANDSENLEIYQYALLVGVGGLWYLFLTIIWYLLNPKKETEELLTETYELTAEFIEIRGKLLNPNEDREKLQSKLLRLKSKLTENHKTLREILILFRKTAGSSNYHDERLLVLAELIGMMEKAVANPVNYDRMDKLFNQHPQFIGLFQDLIFKMADQMWMISETGNNKIELIKNDGIKQCFEDLRQEVALLTETLDYEDFLILQNLLEYQEKQFKKLKQIKWLLNDPDITKADFIDRKTAKDFVVFQDYNPMLLIGNFNFKSAVFRHSVRLAITIMIGFAIGSIFAVQNPYWILLSIIVIMRPSYGLTKDRAKDRMIGTLVGAAIALGTVFFIQHPYLYGVLGVISLVIALSLMQKSYKTSSTFITLGIVFIYAILQPDILTVVKFRILDTLVGAGLSFMAMLWLLPTWEFTEINENIEKSVMNNKDFLSEIAEYYQQKGNIPVSYNIARKHAFLEVSNLNEAFQRMAQEPKSKQKEMDTVYQLVLLNHNFLSSLASISSYIQHHETTEASEDFKIVTKKIEQNLEHVLRCLNGEKRDIIKTSSESDRLFREQISTFNSLEVRNLETMEKEVIRGFQETHLVWEQLEWLLSISNEMLNLAVVLKPD